MPLRNIFQPSFNQRDRPLLVRWSGAAALVLIAFGLRYWLFNTAPVLPFLLFLPAIVLATISFDRGSGLFATALSIVLSVYFFIEPAYSFALPTSTDTVSVVLFAMTGFFIATVVEALHAAYLEAAVAQRAAETARARAEAGERERDLLLSEFGHRVKNDLQRIVGTLSMQAVGAAPDTAEALRAAAERVRVIARVHDRLARRDGHATVPVREYLHALVVDLSLTAGSGRPIGVFAEAEDHTLSISRAGAVGLIVNELITNALKHAFPKDRAGTIMVTFRREGSAYLLTVADDGVGMPEMPLMEPHEEVRQRGGGMGHRLVRALAAQLGSQIETMRREPKGTLHLLRFPVVQPGDDGHED